MKIIVANMFANMSITNFFLTLTAIRRLLLPFPMRSLADSISSSYHPEANRSFEQVLRSYLKCLTAEQQIIWADWNEL